MIATELRGPLNGVEGLSPCAVADKFRRRSFVVAWPDIGTGRALVAGDLGHAHAAGDLSLSQSRTAGRSLPGRLANRWPSGPSVVFRIAFSQVPFMRCGSA
jgi:hypothetical protein